jgi:hypothetical protein
MENDPVATARGSVVSDDVARVVVTQHLRLPFEEVLNELLYQHSNLCAVASAAR